MGELKTKPSRRSVREFLRATEDPQRRRDCEAVSAMMRQATGKSCLYLKRLADVDGNVLAEIIERSVRDMHRIYG